MKDIGTRDIGTQDIGTQDIGTQDIGTRRRPVRGFNPTCNVLVMADSALTPNVGEAEATPHWENEAMRLDSYRDLDVWRKSLALLASTYALSDRLPTRERYEMARQFRRAAVSILANIAEGNGRFHRREYAHHVSIARGSVLEIEALTFAARHLGYVDGSQCTECLALVDDVGRMLTKLLRALNRAAQ